MKFVPSKDLTNTKNLNIPEGTIIAETLLHIFKYNKLKKVYTEYHDKDPLILINSLIEQLELKFDLPEDDLKNIPSEGSFITVSNHPFRGIDSMLLFKIIYEKRKDFKIIANFLLKSIEPLRDIIIPVNTFETENSAKSSFTGIKEGIQHIKRGNCIGIFPTGEVSGHYEVSKVIQDKEWQNTALKFIRNAEVTVIPIYFHGTGSKWLQRLNAAKLPSELIKKRNEL